jgi:hypothetical protein
MEALFIYLKAKVIDHITFVISENSNSNQVFIKTRIEKIEALENLNQLVSYIETKLKIHQKSLCKAGINYKNIRLFKGINYQNTFKIMCELNISTDEIYAVLKLHYKQRGEYIKIYHPLLENLLTLKNIKPFNSAKIADNKYKKKQKEKKDVWLIYTPMGNKMR